MNEVVNPVIKLLNEHSQAQNDEHRAATLNHKVNGIVALILEDLTKYLRGGTYRNPIEGWKYGPLEAFIEDYYVQEACHETFLVKYPCRFNGWNAYEKGLKCDGVSVLALETDVVFELNRQLAETKYMVRPTKYFATLFKENDEYGTLAYAHAETRDELLRRFRLRNFFRRCKPAIFDYSFLTLIEK